MELTREQAFHSIYMGLAQLMTQEQFTEFKRNFMAMSDYEFQKVLAVLEYCDEHPLEISVKDLVAFRKEMKKRNNVTDENSALHCCPVTYLGENTNRMIWDDICKSKPSDYIHMMGREDTAVCVSHPLRFLQSRNRAVRYIWHWLLRPFSSESSAPGRS